VRIGIGRIIALALSLAGAVAGSACGVTPGDPLTAPATRVRQTRVPGEYLVTLAAGGSVKPITDLYGQFGIKRIQDLGRNIFLVTLTKDPGPGRMEQLRGENAHIQAVQPNYVYGTRRPGGPQ
jgi:hypothetical protein